MDLDSNPSVFVYNYARQFFRIEELDELQFRPRGEVHGWTESQAAGKTKGLGKGALTDMTTIKALGKDFELRISNCKIKRSGQKPL